jgi:hypothetical protein
MQTDEERDLFMKGFTTRTDVIVVVSALTQLQIEMLETLILYFSNNRSDAIDAIPKMIESFQKIQKIMKVFTGDLHPDEVV